MTKIEAYLKANEVKNTGSLKMYNSKKASYIASCYHKNAAFMFGLGFYINGILIKFE